MNLVKHMSSNTTDMACLAYTRQSAFGRRQSLPRVSYTVKKSKRGACEQKAATVLPNRTAATLCICSSLSFLEFDIVRYGGTS